MPCQSNMLSISCFGDLISKFEKRSDVEDFKNHFYGLMVVVVNGDCLSI